MNREITLVDRGRGLQLSTSRITVLDLVPYFQQGSTPAEIIRWIPTLTPEEIAVVEAYYHQHKDELDEQDRQVREYREEQLRLQRLRFPQKAETREQRIERLKRLLHERQERSNSLNNMKNRR